MKIKARYKVGIRDLGNENKMSNIAFLGYMEELACLHSDSAGYGVNDINTKNKVWLLMDWRLKVFKRPKYGDFIDVYTWAKPSEREMFYTYRDFEIYVNGEKIAIATSKWVLFDLKENKISKITSDIISLYNPETKSVFEESSIRKIKEPEIKELNFVYKVRRQDIDINKHMHNLNYLNLAIESLPEDVYLQSEKNNVRIMYKHQILYKESVNCYYSCEDGKSIVTIKSNDDGIIHAIIELE